MHDRANQVVYLVGPGGAGKSTVGSRLAARLNLPFIDLDVEFGKHIGDISDYINHCGYRSYAFDNVQLCLSILSASGDGVIAFSSGFMTYPANVHPGYAALRLHICRNFATFVLLPSLDLETCVRETVRRQITRTFGRPPEREEAVIRQRYVIYQAIPAAKIETLQPIAETVEQTIAHLLCNNMFASSGESRY